MSGSDFLLMWAARPSLPVPDPPEPFLDSWEEGPFAAMPTGRQVGNRTATDGTAIYCISSTDSATCTKNEAYSPLTDTWATLADYLNGVTQIAAAAIQGYVICLGGAYSGAKKYTSRYKIADNTWANRLDMPTARYNFVSQAVNGLVYGIGGYTGSANVAKNEAFDDSTNTWATKADIPTARRGGASALANGKIWIFGGFTTVTSTTVSIYDPAANTWDVESVVLDSLGLSVAYVRDVFILFGGYVDSVYNNTNKRYDPASDTVTVLGDGGTVRYGFGTAVVGGKTYNVGGYTGSAYTKVVEVYNA